mmetsp:Transcript_29375/g.84437  ORF Transcript_29375/g.84437 Transcript_29375/m.84437 type:complete len:432 (-) Transcript_29375:57-1352(-)
MRDAMGITTRVALLSVLSQLSLVVAKVQVMQVTLGNNGTAPRWHFIGKFGFGLGTGRYQIRARESEPGRLHELAKLEIEAYLDEEWPDAEAIADGCSRRAYAKRVRSASVGTNGGWGPWHRGGITQAVRPHVWYFAFSACDAQFPNGTFAFDIEFQATQDSGSHFSVESAWSQQSGAVMLLGFSYFLCDFGRRCHRFWDRTGTLHPVIWTLTGVIVSQYVAQVMHIAHLLWYRWNGVGSPLLEAFAEAVTMSSQVVQTSLMIVIAMGYTLTRTRLGHLGVFLPVCGLVALAQVALVVLDKVQGEAAHTFTNHEGMKGWALLAIRLALYMWFQRAARTTAAKGSSRLRNFLDKFQIAASLHFMAYPLTFCLVPIFAPYWRKPIMDFALAATQVCSNLWLASLFLDRGAYFEASSLSASPLPGGSPPTFFKDD